MDFTVKLFLYSVTAFAVIMILRMFGVFERNKSPKRAVQKIEDTKTRRKKIARANKKMQLYALPVKMFRGMLLPPSKEVKFSKYLRRLDIRDNTLNRAYTPEEYVGKQALPMLLSILTIPLAAVVSLFWVIVPIAAIAWYIFQNTRLTLMIADENEILDDNFLDLYLLLYTQLRLGSRGRLRSTLENYLAVLEDSADTTENDVLKRFATYFLNLLQSMEDHEAVVKLRELYNSSTIINFCNVAGQALAGIDNADNLLTFKMQLTERKIKVMRIKQEKMVASGNRAIMLIYIILFIFIGVGWVSKLPLDMFDSMFGG